LGLTPLLYERSQDAQFLKPTIITLVYGLGFGLVLVLLLVPAVLAAQMDLRRFLIAYRRAMAGRAGTNVRLPVMLASLLVALSFAATLGSQIWTGRMVEPLARILGDRAADGAMGPAFGLFLALSFGGIILVRLGTSAVRLARLRLGAA
jgi:Cu/Ag efflux pump CusA